MLPRTWIAALILLPATAAAQQPDEAKWVDLSLLVAPEYPCTWPDSFRRFRSTTI